MRKLIGIPLFLVLVAVLVISSGAVAAAQPSDIQGHWAEKEIQASLDKGLAGGHADGTFKPDAVVTRAEFVAFVNRFLALTTESDIDFSDVRDGHWFYREVARASNAGYVSGHPDGTFRPQTEITRQEAASMLARVLQLNAAENEERPEFTDQDAIPAWCKGSVAAVVSARLMREYPDGSFQPTRLVTRAETIVILTRAVEAQPQGTTFDTTGVYGPASGDQTIEGNAVITAAGVTLQNTRITGNLYLSEGIGSGDVTLKNVTVLGSTIVKGGGTHSISLENCTMPNMVVTKEGVRIVASGGTSVTLITLETGAALVETSLSGEGFKSVVLSTVLPAGARLCLDGDFESVVVRAEAQVDISGGTVTSFEVTADGAGSSIDVADAAGIDTLTLNAATTVTGTGTIEKATVTATGVTFEQQPQHLDVADDVTVGSGTSSSSYTYVSNFSATNTFGKFKFETDKVTTVAELEGKIKVDGVPAINIAERGSYNGKEWNAFISTTPYQKDCDYVVTCETPFRVQGGSTFRWSSEEAAPAVDGVLVSDVSDSVDGSDLEVSFDGPKGENTRVSSYRILVVRSGDAASFDLADANGATYYTEIPKGSGYTTTLASNACDVDGDPIANGIAYKVFVLSVADGTNATVNALSPASDTITLASESSGGGGDDPPTAITISNVVKTNTFGQFKFDTDKATTAVALQDKIKADGVSATGFAPRSGDTTGRLWNAQINNAVYDHDYLITAEDPFAIDGSYTVSWSSDTPAPAVDPVTVSDAGDNGNGSDLQVSFTAPSGENKKIASYRILAVKSDNADSFDLAAANSVTEATYYTAVEKVDGGYSITLASDARDIDGDLITNGVAYQVFVLSIASPPDSTVNALSQPSDAITLGTGVSGDDPPTPPVYTSSEVTSKGDISIYFSKDMADPVANAISQFTVSVNETPATIIAVQNTDTPTKIKLVLEAKVTAEQAVTVSYAKGADAASQIKSADGGVLESFGSVDVTNNLS